MQARTIVITRWLHFVYGHRGEHAMPALAARWLEERPDLVHGDAFLACAVGDHARVREAITADRDWVNRGNDLWRCIECQGLLGMPPLVAVTHSSFWRIAAFRDRLLTCARLLLDAGADANQSWSADGEQAVSALYGAAGKNHDPELTGVLLAAGANPNDGESLYHSLESANLACARSLLEAGAKVEHTNALHHSLDSDSPEALRLLLSFGGNPNEPSDHLDAPLHHAIRRRRSLAHVEALLGAGADPLARTKDGVSAYKLAVTCGLTDVADLLRQSGAAEPLTDEEQFVAACASGGRREALRIRSVRPDLPGALSGEQLRQLPQMAAISACGDAVRLMVELGWPIDVPGGIGWTVSALHHAVARGDAALTQFLLEHGASWTAPNGFDDTVNGTLAFSSRNQLSHDPETGGDWVGCAKALVAHGMIPDWEGDYSDDVMAFFAAERRRREGTAGDQVDADDAIDDQAVASALRQGDLAALRHLLGGHPERNDLIRWWKD